MKTPTKHLVPKKYRPGHRKAQGCSQQRQIIRHETAERWEREGRPLPSRLLVQR